MASIKAVCGTWGPAYGGERREFNYSSGVRAHADRVSPRQHVAIQRLINCLIFTSRVVRTNLRCVMPNIQSFLQPLAGFKQVPDLRCRRRRCLRTSCKLCIQVEALTQRALVAKYKITPVPCFACLPVSVAIPYSRSDLHGSTAMHTAALSCRSPVYTYRTSKCSPWSILRCQLSCSCGTATHCQLQLLPGSETSMPGCAPAPNTLNTSTRTPQHPGVHTNTTQHLLLQGPGRLACASAHNPPQASLRHCKRTVGLHVQAHVTHHKQASGIFSRAAGGGCRRRWYCCCQRQGLINGCDCLPL